MSQPLIIENALSLITNRARKGFKELSLLVIQMRGENNRYLSIEIAALIWLS